MMNGVGAVILLIAVTIIGLSFRTDDTDQSWWQRSGVSVVTDARTGCQYLKSAFGGLTPRMGADGRHICEQATTGD